MLRALIRSRKNEKFCGVLKARLYVKRKFCVSDGLKMYSYIPQDKQVIVASVPPENDAATPALFLAGKGSLARDFTASLVTDTSRSTS